jgi:phospholipase/lecithinase/hemolysin
MFSAPVIVLWRNQFNHSRLEEIRMKSMRMSKYLLPVIILLLGMRLAEAADPSRLIVFGDSLSDPGNAFVMTLDVSFPPFELIPGAPYARGGLHFSNGPTWAEQLGRRLHPGLSSGPALLAPKVFSNYAVGASRARMEGTTFLATQVGWFLRDAGGVAPADALYVVYLGNNDIRDALAALVTDPSGATSGTILTAAVTALRDNLLTLYGAGARRFLIPNAPNLALLPAVRLQGPQAQAAAQWLSTNFNFGLTQLLNGLEASVPVKITRLDVFSLLSEVVAQPGSFGFADVEHSCITPGTLRGAYCVSPDSYLFWDGIHPTRAGHALLAQRAYVALQQP